MESRVAIVFGPTGAVGSATALTAEKLGAKVILAMRDVEKSIPGLDLKANQANFEKLYADLNKPDTVQTAVARTGATYAFIYCAHGSSDHMKSTIEALKSSGIMFVVFLSSFTVRDDPRAIQPQDIIPYWHARVEVNLQETFGPNGFLAVRPGSFASNTLQYKAGLKSGTVKIFSPNAQIDCIVPEDIGRVCGTILAKGPPENKHFLYLYGSKLFSQRDAVTTLANQLKRTPKIEIANEEEALKIFVEERGVPIPVAKYMISRMGKQSEATNHLNVFGYPINEEELLNVERYSGRKPTTFEEWVGQNELLFLH